MSSVTAGLNKKKKIGKDLRRDKEEKWDPSSFGKGVVDGITGFLKAMNLDAKGISNIGKGFKNLGDKILYAGSGPAILGIPRSNMKNSYKVTGKQLGEGGFGLVYEVIKKKGGVSFACKEQSKDRIVDEGMEKLVMNEYLILEHLKGHPNIVQLEAAIEGRYHVYFLMDFCSGGDVLESIIEQFDQKGVYTEKDAADIMRDMLVAVKYCHNRGVVHRDIKPENFLWQKPKAGGRVLKLTDFGLSQVITKTHEKMTSSCGTPNYMPPEMWLDEEYTSNVDVWSLGVSLALMVTGEFPFDGDTEEALAREIVQKKLNWVAVPLCILSAECQDLLKKMLEKDGNKRISVAECLKHPWLNGEATDRSLDTSVKKGIHSLLQASTFQKAVLRLLVVLADDEEVEAMLTSFKLIDTNGDGAVSYHELIAWIKQRPHLSGTNEDEIKRLFDQMDDDNNGTLNVEEYIIMAMGLRAAGKKIRARELFNGLDIDGDNVITREEAQQVFKQAGLKGEYFWKTADKNNDGVITYEEFDEFMEAHMGHFVFDRETKKSSAASDEAKA